MIDSVPLIQNANDAQQINASIIALKKASRELDEKIVKLNSLNSELDKKIALLDSGLNKEIEDRKEAINSLDVPSVGGSGKYISAISETDGKISATASDITSTVSSGNSQPVTSGGVAEAIGKVIYDDTITDCNNAWQKGKTVTYTLVNTVANLPTNESFYVISQCNSSSWSRNNYVTQIATYADNVNKNGVYTRHAYLSGSNMVWTSWVRLIKDTDVVDTVASGNSNPVTSGGVFTALRGLETFYVLYGTPKVVSLSTWGSWLVIGNIDGSGNFGFFMTIANSYLSVQNLVTGTMGSYFLASVTNNKITVGNGTHNLEITISGSTLTFTKTTSAGVHITIIGAGANIT